MNYDDLQQELDEDPESSEFSGVNKVLALVIMAVLFAIPFIV